MKKSELVYWGVRWLCRPSQVIVILDGDQELASKSALRELDSAYSDPTLRVAYSSSLYIG